MRRADRRRRPASAARQIVKGDGAVIEADRQSVATTSGTGGRAARVAAEELIARIAPAREERLFLLLSIFIGVISGLLVVSFRMAIEWLSVLLQGSAPAPHQSRLII